MLDGPKRIVGGGESINILDPSLVIEGYFTDLDIKYARETDYLMLSYVEEESDIAAALKLRPDAKIVAKIESKKGLDWVRKVYPKYRGKVTLMAARGDLYVEMGRPDKILGALKEIIKADPNAIVASRIFGSLNENSRPICSDITDIACMLEMGYRTFMVGDDICFNRDKLLLSLDMLAAIARNYGV